MRAAEASGPAVTGITTITTTATPAITRWKRSIETSLTAEHLDRRRRPRAADRRPERRGDEILDPERSRSQPRGGVRGLHRQRGHDPRAVVSACRDPPLARGSAFRDPLRSRQPVVVPVLNRMVAGGGKPKEATSRRRATNLPPRSSRDGPKTRPRSLLPRSREKATCSSRSPNSMNPR